MSQQTTPRIRTVDILVYDGVDELDVFGPFEVLRRAERLGAPVEVRLASVRGQARVTGSFGTEFTVDRTYGWESDVLVVPGGNWAARGAVGAWAEVQRGDWLEDLREASQGANLTAAVCTGTLLLAAAGAIGDRPASTHASAVADLTSYGVTTVRARVLDAEDLVTGGGVTSGIDVALHLVGRLFGERLAAEIATAMEYRPAAAIKVCDLRQVVRPTLSTPLLTLRPFRRTDLPAFAAYFEDPEVTRYTAFVPGSAERREQALEQRVRDDRIHTRGDTLCLALVHEDEVVGEVSLRCHGEADGTAEVGIAVAREAGGRGFGAEALCAMVQLGFGPLGLHRLHARIDQRNDAAARLFERLGFRREAEHRAATLVKGEWIDDFEYALLRADSTVAP